MLYLNMSSLQGFEELNCSSFAAEIHMVHWNSKYNNFTFAAKQDDGLAVLTMFAEVRYNNVIYNMIM